MFKRRNKSQFLSFTPQAWHVYPYSTKHSWTPTQQSTTMWVYSAQFLDFQYLYVHNMHWYKETHIPNLGEQWCYMEVSELCLHVWCIIGLIGIAIVSSELCLHVWCIIRSLGITIYKGTEFLDPDTICIFIMNFDVLSAGNSSP